jgi:hypothetical protein
MKSRNETPLIITPPLLLNLIPKNLAEFFELGLNNEATIRLLAVEAVIVLMIILGNVKGFERHYLGYYGIIPGPAGI